MKKILYSEMDSLGCVMDTVLQNSNLKQGVKKATLFKFWNKVVGKKFESVSEITALNVTPEKTILTVACANAAVTSELTMFKTQLIKKMNVYANPLDINIDDILFSHKIWQTTPKNSFENKTPIQTENPYLENLDGFEPDKIELDEDEIKQIKANVESNSALTPQQKERLLNSIINDIKVQKFLKSK